jgi:hypothetical protein
MVVDLQAIERGMIQGEVCVALDELMTNYCAQAFDGKTSAMFQRAIARRPAAWLGVLLVLPLGNPVLEQELVGNGNQWGGGFTADGQGGWRGWGSRYGEGWRPDGQGGYDGLGRDYAAAWRRP